MASKIAQSVSDCEKTTMSPFVERIYNNLCDKFNLDKEIPEVSVRPFKRGEEMFGSQRDKKVMLLDREEPLKIKLLQFDPNFFSSEVFCRFNGCSKVKKEEKAPGLKRDLFLCTKHYKQLRMICGQPRYEKEKSSTKSTEIQKKSSREDYRDYINIIGVLDAVYHKLKNTQFHNKEGVPKSKIRKVAQNSCLLKPQEVLDFRNLLVLTNVLLNPSSAEIILQIILPFLWKWASGREVSQAEVRFVLNLGLIILEFFRIIYRNLPETGDNPGKIIGWGAGGLTGLIGFHFLVPYLNSPELLTLPPRELLRFLGLYVSAHGICCLIVAYFFGCIASGVYQWCQDWRTRRRLDERAHTSPSGIYSARSTRDQNVELEFVPQHDVENEDDDEDDDHE